MLLRLGPTFRGHLILVYRKNGKTIAFATFTRFTDWITDEPLADYSVYVDRNHRRKGIARVLMEEIGKLAEKEGYKGLVACIDLANTSSIWMHEKTGFTCIGSFTKQSLKDNRKITVLIYERPLNDK